MYRFQFVRSVSIAMIAVVAAGCASRYRLELFLTAEESRRKIKVEGTEYIANALIDPTSDEKTAAGPGNCIVLILGARGERGKTPQYSAISYDEYLLYRVYLQLPVEPKPSTIPLSGNAFVQLIGRYDQPVEAKLFLPDYGTLVVDSISSHHLFGTIDGRFKNSRGEPLTVDGKFKVRVAR
ncbi:MAG: hypothetical protein AB1644_12770 [Candidatus Zixiibacteriota bacterium]